MNDSQVGHDGIVIARTDRMVKVRFTAHSACAGCHVKGVCSVSNSEEKVVDVPNAGYDVAVGDQVEVLLELKQGFRAILLAYILPLMVFLVVLFTVYGVTSREEAAGLAAIGSLVPYYAGLFLLRKRIAGSVNFRLVKPR
ncbi:MAG: SoxR reducing system RseC family protein [Bacteroidales bacterium]